MVSCAARSLTLLDQCSFELNNICGMIQNQQDQEDWVQTLSTPGQPDHTLLGRCPGPAGRVDPVRLVGGALDHPTHAVRLKGTLVQ